jgi:hypothetical protein
MFWIRKYLYWIQIREANYQILPDPDPTVPGYFFGQRKNYFVE